MEGSSDDLLYFGAKMSDFIYGCLEFNGINKYAIKLIPNSNNSLYIEYEDVQFNRAEYGHLSLGWDHRKLSKNATESELRMKVHGRFSFMNDFMQSFRVFHFHDTGKTSSLRKAALTNDNEFLREDGANLPAFLYWMQEKFPKEFRKIEMTIRSIAPYFDRFNLAPDRLNDNQIRLRWKEKNSDAYFDAKHLSDGTIRFIALTTLLLQPEAPQVIIIDEPEVGLHPFAINKLAGLIKKASINTQVIISTQSVNLVDNFVNSEKKLPGYAECVKETDIERKLTKMEEKLQEAVQSIISYRFFIPYIQRHEFETLLFADPAEGFDLEDERIKQDVVELCKSFPSVEDINCTPQGAPSVRLGDIYTKYKRKYNKAADAVDIAELTTIEKILEKCPRFKRWIDLLISHTSHTQKS